VSKFSRNVSNDVSSHFTVMIFTKMDQIVVSTALNAMKNNTMKSFLLFTDQTLSSNEWNLLENSMAFMNENYMFYVASSDATSGLSWNIVIFVKNQPQVVVNNMKFLGM